MKEIFKFLKKITLEELSFLNILGIKTTTNTLNIFTDILEFF